MKTVLIVDDQPEVLRLYQRALEAAGYRVSTAASVDAGMQIVDTDAPDAVLVDFRMPFVNGMGMLYRLRQTHPGMPVAIITGMQNLDKDTLQEIAALGAAVHYKPIGVPELQQLVADLVAKRH